MRNAAIFATIVVACVAIIAPVGNAAIIIYTADLTGPAEYPSNPSPGTGTATVTYNDAAHSLEVQVTFSGLLGTTTASHIHSPTPVPGDMTAGVATTTPSFPGFPLGVTSGTYDHTLDLTDASSWNPAFVSANGGTTAGAEAALASSMAAGTAYLNIHTSVYGGGEIRGFLAVPEPGCLTLLTAGAFAMIRRRR